MLCNHFTASVHILLHMYMYLCVRMCLLVSVMLLRMLSSRVVSPTSQSPLETVCRVTSFVTHVTTYGSISELACAFHLSWKSPSDLASS